MSVASPRSTNEPLLLAIESHRSGRLQEAEQRYRAILQIEPGHPDAHHNLGVLAVQTGHVDAALLHFKAALEARPNVRQYWASYIDALMRLNRREEAEAALLKAKSLDLEGEVADGTVSLFEPDPIRIARSAAQAASPESQKLLEAYRSGNYPEVARLAHLLTEAHPEEGFGWKALGAALKQMGKIGEALSPMKRAVELLPADPEAFFNLGLVQYQLGTLSEAETSYRKAVRLYPDYAEARSNLGSTLMELGKLEEAEGSCRKAVELKPDYAKGYNNYGAVLHKLGRLAEAEALFRKAIELSPGFAEAHNNLGSVLFSLGRLEEAQASYQKAISFKPDYAESHYNLRTLKSWTRDDPHIPLLLEVVRTSESLSEKIYASFALGKACEDLGDFDEAFQHYAEGNRLRKQQLGYSIEQDREVFEKVREAFINLPKVETVPFGSTRPILIVGMPRSGTSLVEQILASHSLVQGAGELDILSLLVQKYFASAALTDTGEVSRAITVEYFGELSKRAAGKPYITDKMPQNFRWLGFVLLANPEIRVVHTLRDPMATCWSNFKQYFPAKGLGFTCDLSDLAEYYKLYEELMAFWHEKFPGRIYDLDYEKLTENQEEETRKLLAYCGLPWEEACLEFEKTDRAVKTASAVQVRQKMYKGSSQAWKKFEKHLELLKAGLNTN